jgi:hypothetical protein
MRAIRLELATATHFLRAGRTVSFPEMSSAPAAQGVGMPDLLIEDLGANGLEIECKSFSQEKGRRIGRRQALEFFWLLKKRHWDRLRAVDQAVRAVITVPKSLPSAHRERLALVDATAHNILAGVHGNHEIEGARITVSPVDTEHLANVQAASSARELRDLMDAVTGTTNKETVLIGTPVGGALAMALQSEEDDAMLAGMIETLKNSAPRQFSGSRPGIFVAGFEGLSADQLLEIAHQDQDPSAVPTGLRMHTSRFLESANREHLVGVAFFSADSLRPGQTNMQDSGGTAYYFPKKSGRFWSEDLSGIFGREAGEFSVR